MNFFKINLYKKMGLILFVFTIFFQDLNAQGIFQVKDPPGCGGDGVLPALVICGRSKFASTCQEYQKPCNMADFVEFARRLLIWMITIVLLCIPIYITWIGAKMMWYQSFEGSGIKLAELKKRIFWSVIYLILLLGAWLIVKTIIDVFRLDDRIYTFMIDSTGQEVNATPVNLNR